ncbi:MAG: LemA family protein [Pseudomonadota bacterium]
MEFLILLAIIAALAFWVVAIFNKLVTLKQRVANAFAQIEVQLKRRYDLIPNLVETAKGYLDHERETLEAVTNARAAAMNGLAAASADPGNPAALAELAQAEGMLGAALGRLNVAVEAYPDLKASENMMQLSEELTTTENKIAFSRQSYNDQVMAYNTYKQTFPPNVFADMFGHTADATLLEFEDSAEIQAAPNVSFS